MSDTAHHAGFDRKNFAHQMEMVDANMDRRSRRTRQTLHETLMRLVIERGYDEISVSDICDEANVGRSTFYAHFTDKDDLLRSMSGVLRTVILAEHAAAAQASGAGSPVLGFVRFMTIHLREQHMLYQSLMRGRAGPIMLDLIRQALCDIVRRELADAGGTDNREFTVQFLVGAFMSVLTWWLDRGAREPPEAIETAFRALAERGMTGAAKL